VDVIERERRSLAIHRATLRGGSTLPPPKESDRTFLHGFFLPFSLIAATLRDAELRGRYVRVAAARTAVLAVVAGIRVANGALDEDDGKPPRHGIMIRSTNALDEDDGKPPQGNMIRSTKAGHGRADGGAEKAKPVHVHMPGLHVDLDPDQGQAKVSVLGQDIPTDPNEGGAGAARSADGAHRRDVPDRDDDDEPSVPNAEPAPPPKPPTAAQRIGKVLRERWAWLLAFFAFASAIEGIVIFFSWRWDDWFSFHVSRLAQIRPEEDAAKPPRLGFDLKWAYRKARRRIRGYVVVAAGVPALLPLRLLPGGGVLFTIALTLWGWYWLGIFSAAKSAHAWADEATAPSPLPIRALASRVERGKLVAPLRVYARLWAKLTRSVNPAAATFERSMPAFLGLALARAVLALPGLYFLARPIVPVAAGRLCAECDPADRFSARPVETLAVTGDAHEHAPQR